MRYFLYVVVAIILVLIIVRFRRLDRVKTLESYSNISRSLSTKGVTAVFLIEMAIPNPKDNWFTRISWWGYPSISEPDIAYLDKGTLVWASLDGVRSGKLSVVEEYKPESTNIELGEGRQMFGPKLPGLAYI